MDEADCRDLGRRLELSENKRIRLKFRRFDTAADEESYLWSMVDILTLLLVFFILFYSRTIDSRINSCAVSQKASGASGSRPMPEYMSAENLTPGKNSTETAVAVRNRDETLDRLRRDMLAVAAGFSDSGFDVNIDQGRLVIVIGERITFAEGEADLAGDFKPVLRELASLIAANSRYQVMVAGHTDNTPINTDRFASNWELAAARSISVAKFLIDSGVNAKRVSIEGYAEYRPLYDNHSPEDRRLNRRVEITLMKEGSGR